MIGKLATMGLKAKIGAALGLFLMVALGLYIYSLKAETKRVEKERDKLSLSITDPKTGYIVRLAQARANQLTLEEAIKKQNAAYQKLSDESKARLATATQAVEAAQAKTRDANRRAQPFITTKPQGVTLEQRINDVDAKILQDLKR